MAVVTFRAASHGGANDITLFMQGYDFDHATRAATGNNNDTAIVTLTPAGVTEFVRKFPQIARGDYVVTEG